MHFIFGFLGSFLVALPAFLKRKLSRSGLIAALIVGTLMFGLGTGIAWTMMILFFLSSTIISSKSSRQKERLGRTWVQVIANVGVALFCAWLYTLTDLEGWLLIALILFAGNTADTWGSEIGTRLKGKTFFITNFQAVQPGLSGGISLVGTLVGALGSMFIASSVVVYKLIFSLPFTYHGNAILEWLLILGMGFLVTVLDSYLGALIQAKYQHPQSNQILEEKEKNANLVAGVRFINNDAVNFLSTLLVAIISAFFLFA